MVSLEEQAERLTLLDQQANAEEIETASVRSPWVQQYLDWYQVEETTPWVDELWPRKLRV